MPTLDDVRAILEVRDFNSLIGLREDLFLEVKGQNPYDLTVPSGRYELAKDVSAFANTEGGYLLIGLTTTPALVERTDEISVLDLLPAANFPIARYEGIIGSHLHPRIDGLQVTWIEDLHTPGLGIGCICVPRQVEDRKFFLIAKVVDEGETQKEIVFGIIKRKDDDNDPVPVEDLYRMMQNGRHTTAQRITGIDEKLDVLLEAIREQPRTQEAPADLDLRIKRILEAQ